MILRKFVVIDFETTGLNIKNDKIIEIGGVKVENFKIIDTYNELVNPEILISPAITSLTGIKNEDLSIRKNINKILPEFLNWLGDYPIFAHNAPFDKNFLLKSCDEVFRDYRINNIFIDTFPLLRHLLPFMPNYKLSTLLEKMSIKINNSHRALEDAEALANLLIQVFTKISINDKEVFDLYYKIAENYNLEEKELYKELSEFSLINETKINLKDLISEFQTEEGDDFSIISNNKYEKDDKIYIYETKNFEKDYQKYLIKDVKNIIIDNKFTNISINKYICPSKYEFLKENFNHLLQLSEIDGFFDIINWYNNAKSNNIGYNNGFLYFNQRKLWDKLRIYNYHDCNICHLKDNCKSKKEIDERLSKNLVFLSIYDYLNNYRNTFFEDEKTNIIINNADNLENNLKAYYGIKISIWDYINFFHNLITYDDKQKKFSGIFEYFENYNIDSKILQENIQNTYKVIFDIFSKLAKFSSKKSYSHIEILIEHIEYFKPLYKFIQNILENLKKIDNNIDKSDKVKVVLRHLIKEGENLIEKTGKMFKMDKEKNILWMEKTPNQANYDMRIFSEPIYLENDFDSYFTKFSKINLIAEKIETPTDKEFFIKALNIKKYIIIKEKSDNNLNSIFVMKNLPDIKSQEFDIQTKEYISELISSNYKKICISHSAFKYEKDYYTFLREKFDKEGKVILGNYIDGNKNNIVERFNNSKECIIIGSYDIFEDLNYNDVDLFILIRLPFINQDDYYFKKIIEYYTTKRKVNSFYNYILPISIYKFHKIINNISRNSTNCKILIFDNRIETSNYGKYYFEEIKGRYNFISNLELFKKYQI